MRLWVILQPVETILSRFGSDDLFYFTEVAKNVALGHGLTFDGIHPTTGVQPLWTLILLPFAKAFQNPETALKTILALASFISLITAFFFPLILNRALPKIGYKIGVIAGCVWMLHPKIMQVSFEGTEAALAALAWLSSIGAWLHTQKTQKYYLLGVVLGLGILARIDHLILALTLFIFPLSGLSKTIKKGLQMLPGIAILFGGWLFACWRTTGSISMDSGKVKRLHFLRSSGLEDGVSFFDSEFIFNLFKRSLHSVKVLLQADASVSITVVTLILFMLGTITFRTTIRGQNLKTILPTTTKTMARLYPVLLASALVFLAYSIYLPNMRSWYLIPLFVSATILLATIGYDLFLTEQGSSKPRLIPKTVAVLLILAAVHTEAINKPRKGVDPVFFDAINYVNKNVDAGTSIGAFNAGMVGAWLTPNYTVINLDGVVNHSAGNAISSRSLSTYIKEQGIEYLLDNKGSIEFFNKIGGANLMPRLELIQEFPVDGKQGMQLGLWKISEPLADN